MKRKRQSLWVPGERRAVLMTGLDNHHRCCSPNNWSCPQLQVSSCCPLSLWSFVKIWTRLHLNTLVNTLISDHLHVAFALVWNDVEGNTDLRLEQQCQQLLKRERFHKCLWFCLNSWGEADGTRNEPQHEPTLRLPIGNREENTEGGKKRGHRNWKYNWHNVTAVMYMGCVYHVWLVNVSLPYANQETGSWSGEGVFPACPSMVSYFKSRHLFLSFKAWCSDNWN